MRLVLLIAMVDASAFAHPGADHTRSLTSTGRMQSAAGGDGCLQ
jgi:hypothetical protein